MKKPEQARALYVSVRDPISIRKDVLTSARHVLSALKKHEEYKRIREEKAEVTGDLKRTMDQIRTLSSRLKNLLPQHDIKITIPERQRTTRIPAYRQEILARKTVNPDEFSTKTKNVQETRVQHLEQELADIERTLSELEK